MHHVGALAPGASDAEALAGEHGLQVDAAVARRMVRQRELLVLVSVAVQLARVRLQRRAVVEAVPSDVDAEPEVGRHRAAGAAVLGMELVVAGGDGAGAGRGHRRCIGHPHHRLRLNKTQPYA